MFLWGEMPICYGTLSSINMVAEGDILSPMSLFTIIQIETNQTHAVFRRCLKCAVTVRMTALNRNCHNTVLGRDIVCFISHRMSFGMVHWGVPAWGVIFLLQETKLWSVFSQHTTRDNISQLSCLVRAHLSAVTMVSLILYWVKTVSSITLPVMKPCNDSDAEHQSFLGQCHL